MRGICLALLAATASVNVAAADQSRPESPSIIYIGSAAAPSATATSESIIALGEPGVEVIKVAAVTKKNRPAQMPMVIRGGIVGDAFAAPPAAPVTLPADVKAAPGAPVESMPTAANGIPAAPPSMATMAPPTSPPNPMRRPAIMPGSGPR